MDIVRIIIAIFMPPLGVFLQVGLGGHFWLNILLTLLGYVPGLVHRKNERTPPGFRHGEVSGRDFSRLKLPTIMSLVI